MAEPSEDKQRLALTGKIRNHMVARAFRWAGAAGAVAVPTVVLNAPAQAQNFGEPIEKTYEGVPSLEEDVFPFILPQLEKDSTRRVDDYRVLDSGKTLSPDAKGITLCDDGVLEVSYTFKASFEAQKVMPDGISHQGEYDIAELQPEDKAIFLDRFRQLEDFIKIRFVEAENPNDAYLTCVEGNLSEFIDPVTGKEGVGGYARMPNLNGGLIVMDCRNMQNRPWAETSVSHEIGHALGLQHPHYEKGRDYALAEESDNLNATVMTYEDSSEKSTGGRIAADGVAELAPKVFQLYDLLALQAKYGLSPRLHKKQDVVLGQVPEVMTLVGARDGYSWQIDSAAGPAYIDMNRGLKHVSTTGNAYYWTFFEPDRVEALNDKDNVYVPNSRQNTIIDGDGSSIFAPGKVLNLGIDSLKTGKGCDIIQVGVYSGHAVVTDYDPNKDRIEYDGDYISDYKARRYGDGTILIFKGKMGNVCTLELPNIKRRNLGEIGPIGDRVVGPFANVKNEVQPGKDLYFHHYANRQQFFNLPDSAQIEDIKIGYENGQTYWKFMNAEGEKVASITCHGHRDLTNCFYMQTSEKGACNYKHKISYEGVIDLADGSTLQTGPSGQVIRDMRKMPHFGESFGFNDREALVLGERAPCDMELGDENYLYRSQPAIRLGIKGDLNGLHKLKPEEDRLQFNADSVNVVDCGKGRAVVYSPSFTGKVARAVYINQVEGDLSKLSVVPSIEPAEGEEAEFKIAHKKLEDLSLKLREEIESGLQWAAEQQELLQNQLQETGKPLPIWQNRVQTAPSPVTAPTRQH